jgi:alkylation response protein AidB-like acyl-CoA dehydrogenase
MGRAVAGGSDEEVARLRETARAWRPRLEARADEVERARRVPDDLARELASDGFYRMWVPRSLGGIEMPLVPSLRVLEDLAEGDPSVAWCIAIGITSSLTLTAISETTAQQVFREPQTIMAGVFAPTGKGHAVDGGFRVNGQWAFGSGTQNADWILAGCFYFDADEPITDEHGHPRMHMVLVPREEIEFLDNWNVSGLCGTGSTDFRLNDVFVSTDFIPGWLPSSRPSGPLYQIPTLTLLAVGFGAIALGLARAALREFGELAASKTGTMASTRLAERGETQSGVARAEVALRSARSHYYETAEALWAAAEDRKVTVDHRANLRLANCHAVDTAAEVATAVYRLGGGSSIYAGSRLQRLFRDAHVITQHVQVRSDLYRVLGSQLLGVPRGVGVL